MKKFIITLSIVAFLGILVLPSVSQAITAAELQAQIAALQAQIVQLQAQLAQVQGGGSTQWCHNFNTSLKVGDKGSEVVALQSALSKDGFGAYLEADKVNSEFGEGTASAVTGFQQKYKSEILTPLGLQYGTGYVGAATRAKLNRLYGCGYRACTAPVCQTGYVLYDTGEKDSDGCTIYKCIPSTGNKPPVISGVSGPTTLQVSQTGTWTVTASDPENGALKYSVVWGDEVTTGASAQGFAPSIYIQTATFSHSYASAGVYTPAFTVTDNQGLTAKTSISVTVGNASIPTLNISLDPATPPSQNFTPGQTTVTFAKIKVTAGSQAVNNMNGIQIGSDSANASSFLTNFRVYDGATLITALNVGNLVFNGSYYYLWLDVSNFSLPAYNSKTLSVVADVQSAAPAGSLRLGIAGWNFNPPGASVVPYGAIYGNTMSIGSYVTPSITVLSPNGGEVWGIGKTYEIKWSKGNYPDVNVVIGLGNPNLYQGYMGITGAIPNTGSYQWTISAVLGSAGEIVKPDNNYRISIGSAYNVNNYYESDTSDAAFSIVAAGTAEKTCTDLKNSQSYYFNVCSQVGFDNVCFNKYSGVYQGCTKNTNNDCTINNANASQNILCPISSTQPSITVLSPNGGESWQIPQFPDVKYYDITWKSLNVDYANIYLQFNDGATCFLASIRASEGDYKMPLQYNMPCSGTTRTIVPGNYRIVIWGDKVAYDTSDAAFSIVAAGLPTVSVFGPSTVIKGEPLTMSWSSDAKTACRIWFEGTNEVVNSLSNSGSRSFKTDNLVVGQKYTYTVRCFSLDVLKAYDFMTNYIPNEKGTKAEGGVLVTQQSAPCPLYSLPLCKEGEKIIPGEIDPITGCRGPGKCVPSTTTTTTTAAYITVITPNGGERWPQGSTQYIKFQSNLLGEPIILELYKDNIYRGTIGSSVTSKDGSVSYYQWQIPTAFEAGDTYKVKVLISSTLTVDFSDAAFSIVSGGTTSQSDVFNQTANVLESARMIIDQMSEFLKNR